MAKCCLGFSHVTTRTTQTTIGFCLSTCLCSMLNVQSFRFWFACSLSSHFVFGSVARHCSLLAVARRCWLLFWNEAFMGMRLQIRIRAFVGRGCQWLLSRGKASLVGRGPQAQKWTLHYSTLHYITLHYITLHYIHTYIHRWLMLYMYVFICV